MSAIADPVAGFGPRRRILLRVSAAMVVFWCLVAIFAPVLMPHDPTDFLSDDAFQPPSMKALLGTDYLGRDVLSRMIDGAQITIAMAVAATFLAHLIGGTLGVLAAVRGGLFDNVLSRVVDVLLSLPKIIVGLVVVAAVGSSAITLVVIAGGVYAAGVFRIARALGSDIALLDFVRAARARGEGPIWLLFGEILPNIMMPLAADFAVRLSFAILFMSSLSFLGLGVQPPKADWGGLVRENLSGLATGAWTPIFPALAIAAVSIALNLLVDALGDRHADAASR